VLVCPELLLPFCAMVGAAEASWPPASGKIALFSTPWLCAGALPSASVSPFPVVCDDEAVEQGEGLVAGCDHAVVAPAVKIAAVASNMENFMKHILLPDCTN
jgi:hypothetical protein